jgi:hypothetical protein
MTYAPEYYGSFTVVQSGAKSGQIAIVLIVGDDYLASNGRSLVWFRRIPDGTTIEESTCVLKFTRASGTCEPFSIEFTATLTADGDENARIEVEMPRSETLTIPVGEYFWTSTWFGNNGEVLTQIYNRQLVYWRGSN